MLTKDKHVVVIMIDRTVMQNVSREDSVKKRTCLRLRNGFKLIKKELKWVIPAHFITPSRTQEGYFYASMLIFYLWDQR